MSKIPSLSTGKAVIAILVSGVIILGSVVQTTWATPTQNPQRQSIPTLTPTPADSPPPPPTTPGEPPPPVETPAAPASSPTQSSPSALPSPTVTPQVAGDETPQPTATEREKTETATSTPASTPTPLSITRIAETPATPPAPPVSASAFGIRSVVDLMVMGLGLALLVIGLILIWRHRTQSPRY